MTTPAAHAQRDYEAEHRTAVAAANHDVHLDLVDAMVAIGRAVAAIADAPADIGIIDGAVDEWMTVARDTLSDARRTRSSAVDRLMRSFRLSDEQATARRSTAV